jgi:hypothetical protein
MPKYEPLSSKMNVTKMIIFRLNSGADQRMESACFPAPIRRFRSFDSAL